MTPADESALISLAVQEAPVLISYIRSLFARQNQAAPVLTDADIIAAFQAAFAKSTQIDKDWLAAHPTGA